VITSWIVVAVIILVGLLMSGVFSGAETGLYCASRVRLHLGARREDRGAVHIHHMLDNPQRAISFTLVGTNVMNYLTTSATAFMLSELLHVRDAATEIYTVALLTPVVFVFGEVVPKMLFQRRPYYWLLRCHVLLWFPFQLLRALGILWIIKGFTELVGRLGGLRGQAGIGFDPRERMRHMIQEALAGRSIGDAQSYLIERVMRLSETPVHELMIPRNLVQAVPADADRRDLARFARRTQDDVLPVYDRDPRRIIGTIAVNEALLSESLNRVGDIVTPAVTVGPHETVVAAMERIQQTGCPLLIVADRVGRLLGVVTMRTLFGGVLGVLATRVESDTSAARIDLVNGLRCR